MSPPLHAIGSAASLVSNPQWVYHSTRECQFEDTIERGPVCGGGRGILPVDGGRIDGSASRPYAAGDGG